MRQLLQTVKSLREKSGTARICSIRCSSEAETEDSQAGVTPRYCEGLERANCSPELTEAAGRCRVFGGLAREAAGPSLGLREALFAGLGQQRDADTAKGLDIWPQERARRCSQVVRSWDTQFSAQLRTRLAPRDGIEPPTQ